MSEPAEIAAAVASLIGPNPYRTRDASGSPEAAEVVAWDWLGKIAQVERDTDAALLTMSGDRLGGGGRVQRLYRGPTLIAVTTTFRDDMNFTVLVRWLSPVSAAVRRHLLENGNG